MSLSTVRLAKNRPAPYCASVTTPGLMITCQYRACRSTCLELRMSASSNPKTLCTMNPAEGKKWHPVNDVVMGGRSSSQFHIEAIKDGNRSIYSGIFKGHVTDENNGGFASVARPMTPQETRALMGYTGVQLMCRGDGKHYQIRLQTRQNNRVNRYKFEFGPVTTEWMIVTAAFEQFTATFRGKDITHAPLIDRQHVNEVGLLISKGQLGEFCLQIRDIQLVHPSQAV